MHEDSIWLKSEKCRLSQSTISLDQFLINNVRRLSVTPATVYVYIIYIHIIKSWPTMIIPGTFPSKAMQDLYDCRYVTFMIRHILTKACSFSCYVNCNWLLSLFVDYVVWRISRVSNVLCPLSRESKLLHSDNQSYRICFLMCQE